MITFTVCNGILKKLKIFSKIGKVTLILWIYGYLPNLLIVNLTQCKRGGFINRNVYFFYISGCPTLWIIWFLIVSFQNLKPYFKSKIKPNSLVYTVWWKDEKVGMINIKVFERLNGSWSVLSWNQLQIKGNLPWKV